MSRLLCFGDSFTFGHGLSDAAWQNETDAVDEPSKLAYPSLLGRIMDLEVFNAGSPGASNKEIWDTILRTKFTRDDRVCIMWSHTHRTCKINEWPLPVADDSFVWEPRTSGNYNINTIKALGNWMTEDKTAMSYYEHVYEEVDAELTTLLYANHIESYLRPRITNLLHAVIPNSQLNSPKDKPNNHVPEWDTVYRKIFDTTSIYEYCPKTECGHFGPEAHQKVANLLHARMLHS